MNSRRPRWLATALLFAFTITGLACVGRMAPSSETSKVTLSATAMTENPGVVTIADLSSFRHVYALSDVHGMYDALVPLLENAGIIDHGLHWSAGRSLLVVSGDSIDKGPKSIEVIDFWMKLATEAHAAGGRVLHLLGNHEAEFLADPENPKAKELLSELKAKGIPPRELTDSSYPRGAFLRSLPVAARIGKWLFCHSGFIEQNDFDSMAAVARTVLGRGDYSNDFLIGDTSLLEAKKWWETDSETRKAMEDRLDQSGLFGVVFGHQPGALNVQGADAISEDHRLIKIDNGMAPQAGAHPGSVLVFENPAEMNQMKAPTVSTIRAGSSAPVSLETEVRGPAIDSLDD